MAEPPKPSRSKRNVHWAFRSIKAGTVPQVRNKRWPRNSVDRYVLAKMEAAGLVPNPLAARRALIRRVTYNLIGLPPTPKRGRGFCFRPGT